MTDGDEKTLGGRSALTQPAPDAGFAKEFGEATSAVANTGALLDRYQVHVWAGVIGTGIGYIVADQLFRFDLVSAPVLFFMSMVGLAAGMWISMPRHVRNERDKTVGFTNQVNAIGETASKLLAVVDGPARAELLHSVVGSYKLLLGKLLSLKGVDKASASADEAAAERLLALTHSPADPIVFQASPQASAQQVNGTSAAPPPPVPPQPPASAAP